MIQYLQGLFFTDDDIELLLTAFACLKIEAHKWREGSIDLDSWNHYDKLIERTESLKKRILDNIVAKEDK